MRLVATSFIVSLPHVFSFFMKLRCTFGKLVNQNLRSSTCSALNKKFFLQFNIHLQDTVCRNPHPLQPYKITFLLCRLGATLTMWYHKTRIQAQKISTTKKRASHPGTTRDRSRYCKDEKLSKRLCIVAKHVCRPGSQSVNLYQVSVKSTPRKTVLI